MPSGWTESTVLQAADGREFVLAFQALPIVLLMSVLTTLLFYWRLLPPIVRGLSWVLERALGIGGAVGGDLCPERQRVRSKLRPGGDN